MKIHAKKGDLFSIPLDEESVGLGVVAGKWKKELYLVVFKEVFESTTDFSDVEPAQLTPALASSSLDAKIWHGHWPIVKRNCDTSMIAQPMYKVEEPGGVVAESFDREHRKPIDSVAANKLRYRKTVAPVRLQHAIRSLHGIGDWDPVYDELLFTYVGESDRVVKEV